MSSQKYRTTPDPTLTKMPPGVPFIIGNELAERFSFYGMRTILTVFMTKYLLDRTGAPAFLNDEQAKGVFHLFVGSAYLTPLIGAILSDVFWGKYKTILWISLMYCVGHGLLALMDLGPLTGMYDMAPFLFAGLALIALGSGGIKPCVSANVGDQFGTGNKHLLTQVFNWFYFSINLGSAISTLLTPYLLAEFGPWLAFGVPGVLMAVATLLFWMGRDRFVHVPPGGWTKFRAESFGPDGRRALLNLSPLFLIFVPVFWAIFDQTGSAWVLQAESMDRKFLGLTWDESQVQAVNPVLVLTMIPLFTYVVYPAMGKVWKATPLRKIGVGFVLTAATFALSAITEQWILGKSPAAAASLAAALTDAGVAFDASLATNLRELLKVADGAAWTQEQIQPFVADMPSIGWQFLAYVFLTAAEIMVSIVCLEFAYTQSPPKMKSLIMGVYLLGVSLGNFFVSGLNFVLNFFKGENGANPLEGASYYWFFAGLMASATVVYVVWSQFYKGRTYIQGETVAEAKAEAAAEGPESR